MKIDVLSLGELLVDFTPAGISAHGNPLYEQNPGGAPANVAVAVVRLGGHSALISAVGEDFFGDFLCGTVENEGVDISGVQRVREATTTMAFVSLDEQGDRSFCFARKPGADMLLAKAQLPQRLLENCVIFHFGSISLGAPASREATLYAARAAQQAGALISYDPNWRENLWPGREEGIARLREGLALAHVLKLSQEELQLLAGINDPEAGTLALMGQNPSLRLTVVTLGPQGCFYRLGGQMGSLPAYDVKAVDTTGAGDAFWGCLLQSLSACPSLLTRDASQGLVHALELANAAGALCAGGRGAISSLPREEQLHALLAQGRLLKG